MDGVFFRGEDEAGALEERDDGAVLASGSVGPFVDLVGVGADDGEEPDMSGEAAGGSGDKDDAHGKQAEISRALAPSFAGHVPRKVVVDDVGATDGGADKWSGFADVGILDPVDDTGGEVGDADDAKALPRDRDE